MMTSSLLNKALSLNSDSNLLIKQKECIAIAQGIGSFSIPIAHVCKGAQYLRKINIFDKESGIVKIKFDSVCNVSLKKN